MNTDISLAKIRPHQANGFITKILGASELLVVIYHNPNCCDLPFVRELSQE